MTRTFQNPLNRWIKKPLPFQYSSSIQICWMLSAKLKKELIDDWFFPQRCKCIVEAWSVVILHPQCFEILKWCHPQNRITIICKPYTADTAIIFIATSNCYGTSLQDLYKRFSLLQGWHHVVWNFHGVCLDVRPLWRHFWKLSIVSHCFKLFVSIEIYIVNGTNSLLSVPKEGRTFLK